MAKSLAIAADNLKPEVKLGVALSEFSQALDDKYRQQFIALRGASPRVPTPADVIRVTEELNREGAKTHRTWRPYSTRLCSILHRIQIFASTGDVAIGGAQNMIASGDQVALKDDAGLMSVSEIRDLILRASRVEDKIVIVIDALEEYEREEIDDVSHFVAELMTERTVLACCSSRPGSDYQKRFLSITTSIQKHHISLDNASRSGEIQLFIDAEIERRVGKVLSEDLKDLIKAQLVAGAQRMYLWVSLQLEALFPGSPGIATNSDYIHDILCHLPANLPESFDQALSRISNKLYGNKPFKLVTAAERPLSLDEFRVALTVVPGITEWKGSMLPRDAKAVVYGSGGNLLEVDEETQTVHFIHHSAMVHILSTSTRDDTITLHFELN
ncbi:hypothetical protein PG996_016061 [Apiospora saccharicola]|uniref:Uncharacterized protein n=1 Tax=Apiospora saccharicola TaxID=335842 RepID=A0ABR1TN50_9PEZI